MSKTQWVNLHAHTHYSILDGYSKVEEYVDKAKNRGDIGLGVTDHGTMAGIYEMIKKCQDAGITPVPGFEAYVAPENPEGAKAKHQVFYGPDGHKAPQHDVSGNGAYLHLTLFAYNNTGLHNLLKLTSLSWQQENFYVKPRIDTDMLFKYHEGIIVTTGCPSSEISTRFLLGQDEKAYEYASRLHEVFGDNMYVELMDHKMDDDMERILLKKQRKLAKDLGLPLLATNDSHYANKEDAEPHERMLAMQSNNVMSEPTFNEGGRRFAFSGPEYYMKSDEEMRELFPEDLYPGAIENTNKIVQQCEGISLNYNPHLRPFIKLPEGETEVSYLKKLIRAGFKKKRGNQSKEIQAESLKRIKEEFEVIHSNDFVGYFLIVHDYIHWAHTHGIETGAGRGSVGGSEIAYVMDIGDTDPIKYDLLFERFLSPGRGALYEIDYQDGTKEEANTSDTKTVIRDNKQETVYVHELQNNDTILEDNEQKHINTLEVIRPGSAPDIDTDFHTVGRFEAMQYVADTYGHENVSNIITFGKFKTKNSLKSMATIYEIPFAEANKIVQLLPEPIDGKELTIDELFDESNPRYAEGEEFRRAVSNDKWREVLRMAAPLYGRIRQTGQHACFEAGTLIRTKNGLMPIEDIQQGDYVLTHRNVYKKVADTMVNKSNDVYLLRTANSIPTEVTSKHPFYVREKSSTNNGRVLSTPKWKALEDLGDNDLIGVPINNKQQLPQNNYNLPYTNSTFWWLVGRFLGDGWLEDFVRNHNRVDSKGNKYTRQKKVHNLIISVGHNDPTKQQLLNNVGSLFKYRVHSDRTVEKIFITGDNNDLFDFLNTLGRGALHKKVTDEILNLPIDLLKSFIEGYVSADGSYNPKTEVYGFSTISKELFLTMISAVNKVYKVHCNVQYEKRDKMIIEGRTVNCHDKYSATFRTKAQPKNHSMYQDGYLWVAITNIQKLNKEINTYNLSVIDDNSYIANNLIAHNCGLIISSQQLSDTIPTQVDQKTGTLLTQWTYPYCEALGLIKMDFLGLDTLDIMDNTLTNIEVSGKEVPDMSDLIHHEMNDPKTFELLQNAETTGIFQFGSPGMRDLLQRVKPTKFDDIAAITALFRPGPMKMNSHIQYADRKNGREKITYINPEFAGGPVEDVLKDTYGLCIPENTPIYDATRAMFIPIKELNPYTSTTVSTNPDTQAIEIKPVTNVVKTGEKRIIKFKLFNGKVIRVSETHPILTERGYIEAKDIKLSDKFAINTQEYPNLSNIKIKDKDVAWMTGLYWQENWQTHENLSRIETYDNETLKAILAGMFSASGKINNNGESATITFIDNEYFKDAKTISNVLGFNFSIIRNDKTLKLTINKDDFRQLAQYIPEDLRPELDMKDFAHKQGVSYEGIFMIEDDGTENCYDIEVKDNHNFFVDNVIVHNCIYQEQCMQLATRAAGMSSYEADKLRKAIGKKKMKIMMALRPKFIQGIMDNGYSEEAANQLWDTVQQFGQYGFNKSHSISYAINTYKTCYLKANYPAEFMSSLLQQNTGEPKKIRQFIQETKRMGLRVGPVDVNLSQSFIAPSKDKTKYDIIYGFSGIKQVSDELSNAIINERKHALYKNVPDFVQRVAQNTKMNSQSLKNLALSGAFDKMSVTRRAIVDKASALLNAAHSSTTQKKSLFDLIPQSNSSIIDSIDLTAIEYPYTELIQKEAECIGIYLSGSPTQNLGTLKHVFSPTQIPSLVNGEQTGRFNVLGAFTAMDTKTKKNGSSSVAVRIDDGYGFFDVYLPAKLVESIDKGAEIIRRNKLKKAGKEIKMGTSKRAIKLQNIIDDESITPIAPIVLNEPYLIEVRVTKGKNGNTRITVMNYKHIQTAYDGSIPFEIAIPNTVDLKNLVELLKSHPGDMYVRAKLENKGWKFFAQQINLSREVIEGLEKLIGPDNIITKGA